MDSSNVSNHANAISPLLLHHSMGFTACVHCPSVLKELLEPLNAPIQSTKFSHTFRLEHTLLPNSLKPLTISYNNMQSGQIRV